MPSFFTQAGLTPHGFCLLWNQGLLWLHGASDLLTGLAYFSIPLGMAFLVRRRPELDFGGFAWLFAAAILACGVSHIMAIVTLFIPAYWAEGAVKAITGALSLIAAILLISLIPKILALPSPGQLLACIDELRGAETRLTAALETAASSEARFRQLAENTADLVSCLGPDLRRTYVSPSSLKLLGYTPQEMLGQTPADIVHPDDLPRLRPVVQTLLAGEEQDAIQYRLRRNDGRYIWIEACFRPAQPGGDVMISVRDISSRRAAQDRLLAENAELEEQAKVDALTGLANRRRFDQALKEAFQLCTASCLPISLILIDVDRFKLFNDHYGHQAGDACLRAIADAVSRARSRPRDVAARYGGEEFAIILPGTACTDAAGIAEHIRAAIRRLAIPHHHAPGGSVTVSFGIATLHPGRLPALPTDLIRHADRLLYQAKAQGRDRAAYADNPEAA